MLLHAGGLPRAHGGGLMSESQSRHIDVGVHRYVAVHYSDDGRLSIVVKNGKYPQGKTIVDVELPCLEGPHTNAFKPTVKIIEGIELEEVGV